MSVPEIHSHVAGTLSHQQANKLFFVFLLLAFLHFAFFAKKREREREVGREREGGEGGESDLARGNTRGLRCKIPKCTKYCHDQVDL